MKTDSWFRVTINLCQRDAEPIFSRRRKIIILDSTSVRAITSFDQELDSCRTFPSPGLGWIDSHPGVPGAQARISLNILSAAGISYKNE